MSVSGPVSNSFDYTPVRSLPGFAPSPDACPAAALGLSRAATSLVVLVRDGSRALLCRTRTTSFTPEEIRHVVHACGQLYLDVSGKPAITDFAADVRQVCLSPECRACASLPTCVACYEPTPVSLFARDEEWLRAHLAGLAGRVLDVGLGHVPYLDAIAGRIRAGEVEYHGVDPDPGAAEAAERLGVRMHRGRLEDASDLPEFDHVVAIRSLNHLADPDLAFARIASRLRPGGTLLLVESLPLPLVRSRRHAAACHSGPARFEHLRNWGSHEAIAALGPHPFRVVHHRPVGRDTCDQWFLVALRA